MRLALDMYQVTDAELEDIVKVGMSSLPQLTMGPPTGAPAGTALYCDINISFLFFCME